MTLAASPSVIVRRAVPTDVAPVAAIEVASFADPWTAEAFHSSLTLPHLRFLVAEMSEGSATGAPHLVGYVLAMVLGPEGEIADIAVAQEARGLGIGGRMLDEVTRGLESEGVRTIYLEVRESNVAARRLYEGRQFGHVGRRPAYYQHPAEDALVLRRDLAPT